jgi:hypothetical protein
MKSRTGVGADLEARLAGIDEWMGVPPLMPDIFEKSTKVAFGRTTLTYTLKV